MFMARIHYFRADPGFESTSNKIDTKHCRDLWIEIDDKEILA